MSNDPVVSPLVSGLRSALLGLYGRTHNDLADAVVACLDAEFPGRHGQERGYSELELRAALRAHAEAQRREGGKFRNQFPSAMDLKTLIIRARYQARLASETEPPAEGPASGCALCDGTGMLGCWPSLAPPAAATITACAGEYAYSLPCQCSAGQRIARQQTEWRSPDQGQLAAQRLATEQARSRSAGAQAWRSQNPEAKHWTREECIRAAARSADGGGIRVVRIRRQKRRRWRDD